MSCINIEISMLNALPTLSYFRVGGVSVHHTLITPPITLHTNDISSRLSVNCGIICSINYEDLYEVFEPIGGLRLADGGRFYVLKSEEDVMYEVFDPIGGYTLKDGRKFKVKKTF